MFYIVSIADTLKVEPCDFAKGDPEAIVDCIDQKYPGRVLMELGLVCSLYDVISVGAGTIQGYGDGATSFQVVFRLVMFKPFLGEIVEGVISKVSPEGMRVSLGFFEDIQVPYYNLLKPARFDDKEKLWIWDDYLNDEDAEMPDEKTQLDMKRGDAVRFQVKSVIFTNTWHSVKGIQKVVEKEEADESNNPSDTHKVRSESFEDGQTFQEGAVFLASKAGKHGAETSNLLVVEGRNDPVAPKRRDSVAMSIIGNISGDGLGKPEWWSEDEEEEEEERRATPPYPSPQASLATVDDGPEPKRAATPTYPPFADGMDSPVSTPDSPVLPVPLPPGRSRGVGAGGSVGAAPAAPALPAAGRGRGVSNEPA
ncbi:hypothetical protein TeGR_g8791 [Tetraparma gracilis]|uniref:DNA-directed RNA polymerase III subunit RPC8 n=1 Tax=Tetraparma gracilis TaxID=2962635 RepID=A0ABQ6M575_9STRA|nr:hypothetical protein TeGR_g8791 [Tetraparma gracilis]